MSDGAQKLVQQLMLSWPSQETVFVFLALDSQGTIIWASPSVEQVLNYSQDELLGQNFEIFFTLEDRAKGIPEHELRVANAVGYSEDDRWHARRDGTLLWANGVTTAVNAEDGTLLGYAKVTRDRTDLKTQLVTLQNRVLSHQQAEHRRSAFDQTLAHEQANALHAIAAAAQVLSLTTTERPQAVEIIQRQVKTLERLIGDLKGGVPLEQSGVALLSRQPVEVQEILAQVCAALRQDADASGVPYNFCCLRCPSPCQPTASASSKWFKTF